MMNTKDFIKRWQYEIWADRLVSDSIMALPAGRGRASQLFSHLIESKVLWYQRIHGEHKHITTVWSDLPITRCLDVLSEINSNWDKFVHELSEEVLQRTITYKTMNGQPYQSTVHDILTHILNHSTYHRGQIAMEVRKAGGTPAQTDYITFCRE